MARAEVSFLAEMHDAIRADSVVSALYEHLVQKYGLTLIDGHLGIPGVIYCVFLVPRNTTDGLASAIYRESIHFCNGFGYVTIDGTHYHMGDPNSLPAIYAAMERPVNTKEDLMRLKDGLVDVWAEPVDHEIRQCLTHR